MKRCLLIFTILLSLVVCSCNSELEFDLPEDSISKENGNSPQLLNFLGDSIIDYWENVSMFFPGYDCINYGWSTKGIDTFLGKVNLKMIEDSECVIEIGTNDMRKVIIADSIDNYIEHYIDVLMSLNAKRIYLLSLLPRNRAKDGGFDFNSYYPEINTKIQERTTQRMDNIIYIPLFDEFLRNGQINWDYTYDGLHPNYKGYVVIANEINKHLVK